ncbi:hypothetical protein TI39_contig625g00001 [Zymoseptoria brevis]|uniref:Cyanovirin-N domain-containing protein n=1 Tax=Zymoseptoria brevis TaxID=1047168 RepID=A0A0F4GG98_9PEZI|nr:hypothetical protein TI39_contig625g00001 [Zymoseptoria brevis]
MRFTHQVLFLAAAIPAILVAAEVTISHDPNSANNKRNVPALFGRDDGIDCPFPDGTPELFCDTPGTTSINLPHTCPLPLSNDPLKPGRDVIIRNGQGSCYQGECACTIMGLSKQDVFNTCVDLISRVAPAYHVIDACLDGEEFHCTADAPDETAPPNVSGTDLHFHPGRVCYNGVYHPSPPGRK